MRRSLGGRFGITEGGGGGAGDPDDLGRGRTRRGHAAGGLGVGRFGGAWAGGPARAALKRRTPGTLARVFEGGGVSEGGEKM